MDSEEPKERFPKNAQGPFYVANGECITCMAPEHAAPELMGFDEEARHCYFKRQSSTPDELERAVRAVWVSCCGAVQYSGDDANIRRLIAEYDQEGLRRMCQGERRKPWWKVW